jgi:hypothetical protein
MMSMKQALARARTLYGEQGYQPSVGVERDIGSFERIEYSVLLWSNGVDLTHAACSKTSFEDAFAQLAQKVDPS